MADGQPPKNQLLEHRFEKSQTGIKGLDEILEGGFPSGRPTLVCGGPGCGKTLMACEFLVRGALDYNEPGVFMAFEETPDELSRNLASLGIDLDALIEQKRIFIDYVHIDCSEIEETGEYDLEGLFIRLADAIDTVGAKRVVLDTIENIFVGFSNEALLRSELHRLFRWLKNRGLTAVITGERGEGTLTRQGLEEYVSDCVILLDHRVREGTATRFLRVVKYRGSSHGYDEYPFLIDQQGIWVMPITSVGLNYTVSREFISSGIPSLDNMLNGKGYFRGSSILISGTAGTGKTSIAAHLADATCRRGERCLFFAFEESADQIIRNMSSIGLDLRRWVEKGLLRFQTVRPSIYGTEMHLLTNQRLTEEFQPSVVVVDPMTNLISVASIREVKSLMIRLIDFYKMNNITGLFTSLTQGGHHEESTEIGISSLMDTWILVRDIEINGERNRGLSILKSRGMPHSNQVREFRLTDEGIELADIYVGPAGVLTGTARLAQEAVDAAETLKGQQEIERKRRELERKRRTLEAQIIALQTEFESEEEKIASTIEQEEQREQVRRESRKKLARVRQSDPNNQ